MRQVAVARRGARRAGGVVAGRIRRGRRRRARGDAGRGRDAAPRHRQASRRSPGPYRTAALIGDTLVVAGCDKATHNGCAAAVRAAPDRHSHAGTRERSTRAPRGSSAPAATSWSSATACASTRRTGSCASTLFKGRDGRRAGRRHARLRAHRRRGRQRDTRDRPAHRQGADAPGAGSVRPVRWLPLVPVALVACGGNEPKRASTTPVPSPGPHWRGPVAFAAERDGSLDVFVRDGDRTRRLTRGKRDEIAYISDSVVFARSTSGSSTTPSTTCRSTPSSCTTGASAPLRLQSHSFIPPVGFQTSRRVM